MVKARQKPIPIKMILERERERGRGRGGGKGPERGGAKGRSGIHFVMKRGEQCPDRGRERSR